MKLKWVGEIRVSLFFMVLASVVSASGEKDGRVEKNGQGCAQRLWEAYANDAPAVQVISSGRDHDVFPRLEAIAKEVMDRNGLLKKLGLHLPPQIVQFMPGFALKPIAGVNRYPVGHWIEGAESMQGSNGVLEIVLPGFSKLHSLYRDDIPLEQKISIMFHVIGHSHFIGNNHFIQDRGIDVMGEAWAMDRWMEGLKSTVGADEVSEWYQYLKSMEWSQDVVSGVWEEPAKFKHEPPKRQNYDFADEMKSRHPKSPTQNILQAFIANFPSDMPEWKKEMAVRFERLHRYIPGNVRTKIMNEGFATLMQEFLAKHTNYSDFNHAMHYCCLMGGVVGRDRDLNNPYWLGLQIWRKVYYQFIQQLEIKNLDPIEKDRRFILWATKNIIYPMDDMQFLSAFIDESWIARHNLFIRRKAKNDEHDWGLPPPEDEFEVPTQYKVVTRDFEAVRKLLVHNVADFSMGYPVPYLRDLNFEGRGEVFYEMRDPIGIQIPIKKKSLVKYLLVHARLWNRPVTFEGTIGKKAFKRRVGTVGWWGWQGWGMEETVELTRVRVTVDKYGRLEVYRVNRNGSTDSTKLKPVLVGMYPPEEGSLKLEPDEELKLELEKHLKGFMAELAVGVSASIHQETEDFQRLHGMLMQAVNGAGSPDAASAMLYVPTLPHALSEYYRYVSNRLVDMFRLSMKQDDFWKRLANGVRLKVLPEVPNLRFDGELLRIMLREQENSLNLSALPSKYVKNKKNVLDIGSGGEQPGDLYWDEGDGEGNGSGDDDGDGDGDQDGDGRDPGEGGNDISYVDIPLDLYAKLLDEYVELPNLRPKEGRTTAKETHLKGEINRRQGIPVTASIARKAFKRGWGDIAAEQQRESLKEDQAVNPDEIKLRKMPHPSQVLRRGLSLLQSSDWVVRNEDVKKTPDINAVIIMCLDMSGSMSGIEDVVKKMFFDLRAILKNKYKRLEFRFIAFDYGATVFDDFHKFLKARLGGGTSYSLAFKKAIEVQKDFPESKWDRYVITAGDLEDHGDDQAKAYFDEAAKMSSYSAVMRTNSYPHEEGGWGTWEPFFLERLQSDPYFGYVDVSPPESYNVSIFRKLFRNDEKEK